MAGASMNDIKSRMKSVQSTMQITKAMELVATSKLRRAKERVERARPYHEALGEAIRSIESSADAQASLWSTENGSQRTLYIVIAGDRGLAGGYNANVFRMTEALAKGEDAVYLPIGKKALEYYRHRGHEIFSRDFGSVSEIGVGDSLGIGAIASEAFKSGEVGSVVLIYTRFASMMTQIPTSVELLPLNRCGGECRHPDPLVEGGVEEVLDRIVPDYIGGIIYSAICESSASESGARRSAMNAANKNASQMIDELTLKYNRARQAVITQEITEIVSGSQGDSY